MKNKKYSNFLELAKSRKTTYEFSGKKVKSADIKKILEAARWAPSCSNIQPWYFIVISDKKKISEIVQHSYYGAFHTDPPILIALVLNEGLWAQSEYSGVKNCKVGIRDAFLCLAMPALNMILEAQDLGLNSALVSPEVKIASKTLKLKGNNIAPLVVALGYETQGAFQKKRERKGLKELVFWEYFGGKSKL